MKIVFDRSWHGCGGIGRFSDSISENNQDYTFIEYKNPASPLSTIKLSLKSFFYRKGTVLLIPSYIPPIFSKIPYIFTIHDLNHVDIPDNSSFFKRFFYKTIIRFGCKKASFIFTVSEFSKKRIVDYFNVAPEKVINVGNGVDSVFNPLVIPYNPGYKYLLCVSNRKKHKNEINIIKSFSNANIDPDIKLIFTGSVDLELKRIIEHLKIANRIVFLGSVEDSFLPSLYRGALGLIMVSLYEGFGLPVIESMACGTPVITSNVTSLPEISGNAAILVDPHSCEKIALSIGQLVCNEQLRKYLIDAGIENSKKYIWSSVKGKILNVLNSMHEG